MSALDKLRQRAWHAGIAKRFMGNSPDAAAVKAIEAGDV